MKQIIKDLYIKAGVEPASCFNCGMDSDCSRCKFQDNLEYPPYVAEKQIALLQILLDKFKDFGVLKWIFNNKYKVCVRQEFEEYKYEGDFTETLGEAIASAVIKVWDDFSKAEKKKVFEILATADKEDLRWAIK